MKYSDRANSRIVFLTMILITFAAVMSVQAADQTVFLTMDNQAQGVGSDILVNVNYDVSDKNPMLSGIDISVHYDSEIIEYVGCQELLSIGDQVKEPAVISDIGNEDNDLETDKRIALSWVSFSRQWPGIAPPAKLAALKFKIRYPKKMDHTRINVSIFDHDAKYTSKSSGIIVPIIP